MNDTTFTANIKTHVTPAMKADFALLAAARGVKRAVIQRQAFMEYLAANARTIQKLRTQKPGNKIAK